MAIPDATLEMERRKALTRRVEVGAVYTDGTRLGEVYKTYKLGHVIVKIEEPYEDVFEGFSIDAFRGGWWLVRAAEESDAA